MPYWTDVLFEFPPPLLISSHKTYVGTAYQVPGTVPALGDVAVDKTESCFKETCLLKVSGTWRLRMDRCRVNESKTVLIKTENRGGTFGLRWQMNGVLRNE